MPGRGEEPIPGFEADLGGVHVIFASGALSRLGEAAAALGRRPLLVTDPGIARAGHAERARVVLEAHGLHAAVFTGTDEGPGEACVERARAAAVAHGADLLVGLGGGSAMDVAKGANFLITNGGRMSDYRGHVRATRPLLASVAVPTTAGTGAEAQSYALIAQEGSGRKMACGDPRARFKVAILDPDLLASAPRRVAAASGLDALGHAVESYVCLRKNPVSSMLARAAFAHLDRSFAASLAAPPEPGAQAEMLLGAHLAGAAIEASMLGAAHALANPLSERHGAVHGVAVGLLLPHVVRFNAPAAGKLYAELLAGTGDRAGSAGDDAADALAGRIDQHLETGGLPRRLRELGVPAGSLEELAVAAAEQWTAGFNPRPVAAADLLGIYRSAF